METRAAWDDSRFEDTLRRYSAVSKRTFAEIVNTKLFYIARKAIWFTPKADVYGIKQRLGGVVTVSRLNKKGKSVKRRVTQLVNSDRVNAPLAALIVNSRRKKAGLPGLYGPKMETAIKRFLGGTMSSIAFLKAGWLPTVKGLAPLVKNKGGAQAQESGIRQIGRPKGWVDPAVEGFSPVAMASNTASARHDYKDALTRYGQPALDQAYADEGNSMLDYIEQQMRPEIEAFNAAQRN